MYQNRIVHNGLIRSTYRPAQPVLSGSQSGNPGFVIVFVLKGGCSRHHAPLSHSNGGNACSHAGIIDTDKLVEARFRIFNQGILDGHLIVQYTVLSLYRPAESIGSRSQTNHLTFGIVGFHKDTASALQAPGSYGTRFRNFGIHN